MQHVRQQQHLESLGLLRFDEADFDAVLTILSVVEAHPSIRNVSLHFRGEHASFGTLDETRAGAIGRCLTNNQKLRSFSLRVGGCTLEGAAVLSDYLPRVRLERLLLFGPISVEQASCIVGGIERNLSLVDVRDLGTDEEWEETMNRVQLNGCLLYTSPSPRDQRGSRMPSSA